RVARVIADLSPDALEVAVVRGAQDEVGAAQARRPVGAECVGPPGGLGPASPRTARMGVGGPRGAVWVVPRGGVRPPPPGTAGLGARRSGAERTEQAGKERRETAARG